MCAKYSNGGRVSLFAQTCREGFFEGEYRTLLGEEAGLAQTGSARSLAAERKRVTSDSRDHRGRHDLLRAHPRGLRALLLLLRDRLQNRDRRRCALPEDALR